MPDIPTLAESGLPKFDVPGWYSFFVPAKTPPAIVQKMTADTIKVLAEPATKGKLEGLGLRVIGSSAEELAQVAQGRHGQMGPADQGGRHSATAN